MQGKVELIRKRFDKAGITDALNMDYLIAENPCGEDDIIM